MRLSALAAALAAVAVSAQSPPPPPPPVGEWAFVDVNEVIAVDIEFGAYAAHQAMYREAFAGAFANVSDGLTPYVVDFHPRAPTQPAAAKLGKPCLCRDGETGGRE